MINELLLKEIKETISNSIPNCNYIIQDTIAVPFFGNIEKARCATLSINPSDVEFTGGHIKWRSEICGKFDYMSIDSIQLLDFQTDYAYELLRDYFDDKKNNPYKSFFNWQERMIKQKSFSYYDGSCFHLDLIPWATTKWSLLQSWQKDKLLSENRNSELNIINNSEIEYLFVCGKQSMIEFANLVYDSNFSFGRPIVVPIDKRAKRSRNNLELFSSTYNGIKVIAWKEFLRNAYFTSDELFALENCIRNLP